MSKVYHDPSQPELPLFPVYSVYALIDPRDNAVRYIGMSKQPEHRLDAHKKRHFGSAYSWIQELLQQGLEPVLTIIETYKDERAAIDRENHWIRYYMAKDAPLLNKHPYNKRPQVKRVD